MPEHTSEQMDIIIQFLNKTNNRIRGRGGMPVGQAIVEYATELEETLARERIDFMDIVSDLEWLKKSIEDRACGVKG